MKKAFTLIELVIVILIIWILFWAFGYMSWDYVEKLNVQNDTETVQNSFSYVQSSTLSQPNFGKYDNLKYAWIKLTTNKDYTMYVWFTWGLDSSPLWLQTKVLYTTHIWTGFSIYSWTDLIKTFSGSAYFVYKPYTIGATFIRQKDSTDWQIYTWNKIIQFYIINKSGSFKKCFRIGLLSWRLFNVLCK